MKSIGVHKRKPSAIHYELGELIIKAFANAILINIPVLIILFIASDYPLWLGTIDATITVLMAVFLIIVFPLMLSGKIPAYYRRSYLGSGFGNKFFALLISCPMRAIVTYGVLFASIGLADSRKSRYIAELYEYLLNPKMNLTAFGIFMVAILYIFYFKRCFTIREYREGMVRASHRISNPTEERCYQRLVDESYNRARYSAEGNNCLDEVVKEGPVPQKKETVAKSASVVNSVSEPKTSPVKKTTPAQDVTLSNVKAEPNAPDKDKEVGVDNMVRRRARNI